MKRLPPFVLLAALLLPACRETHTAAPTGQEAVSPGRAVPAGLRWMRSSAEYAALLHQTWVAARERLEERTAGLEAGRWAIAIDADETILDNSPYQKQLAVNGEAFDQETWLAWCRRREAKALPGVREFLEGVRELGGRIAVVTNRSSEVCADTEANLTSEGVPFDVALCRPPDTPGDKQARWRSLEEGTAAPGLPPLTIVMWLGDNISDFPGLDQALRGKGPEAYAGFGTRFFVVPNPAYGSWERNPEG